MKILVVSDTHRNFAVLDDIVNENLDADLIIHLGDGENEAPLGAAALALAALGLLLASRSFRRLKELHL